WRCRETPDAGASRASISNCAVAAKPSTRYLTCPKTTAPSAGFVVGAFEDFVGAGGDEAVVDFTGGGVGIASGEFIIARWHDIGLAVGELDFDLVSHGGSLFQEHVGRTLNAAAGCV